MQMDQNGGSLGGSVFKAAQAEHFSDLTATRKIDKWNFIYIYIYIYVYIYIWFNQHKGESAPDSLPYSLKEAMGENN